MAPENPLIIPRDEFERLLGKYQAERTPLSDPVKLVEWLNAHAEHAPAIAIIGFLPEDGCFSCVIQHNFQRDSVMGQRLVTPEALGNYLSQRKDLEWPPEELERRLLECHQGEHLMIPLGRQG